MMVPEFTCHGRKRWVERCSGFDFDTEWASAKPPSKRQRALLGDHGQYKDHPVEYRVRFMISQGGVVFVLSFDGREIVTVYHYREQKRRVRARREWHRKHGTAR